MSDLDFGKLFKAQVENQRLMFEDGRYDSFMPDDETGEALVSGFPLDSPSLASYHIQQLVSEIGEVLEADKRWKNFRNDKYDRDAKLDELADCMIVLMNIIMFSGFTADEAYEAIKTKIQVVNERILALTEGLPYRDPFQGELR